MNNNQQEKTTHTNLCRQKHFRVIVVIRIDVQRENLRYIPKKWSTQFKLYVNMTTNKMYLW